MRFFYGCQQDKTHSSKSAAAATSKHWEQGSLKLPVFRAQESKLVCQCDASVVQKWSRSEHRFCLDLWQAQVAVLCLVSAVLHKSVFVPLAYILDRISNFIVRPRVTASWMVGIVPPPRRWDPLTPLVYIWRQKFRGRFDALTPRWPWNPDAKMLDLQIDKYENQELKPINPSLHFSYMWSTSNVSPYKSAFHVVAQTWRFVHRIHLDDLFLSKHWSTFNFNHDVIDGVSFLLSDLFFAEQREKNGSAAQKFQQTGFQSCTFSYWRLPVYLCPYPKLSFVCSSTKYVKRQKGAKQPKL